MNEERLALLIEQYHDGTITTDEQEELLQAWSSNENARTFIDEHIHMSAALAAYNPQQNDEELWNRIQYTLRHSRTSKKIRMANAVTSAIQQDSSNPRRPASGRRHSHRPSRSLPIANFAVLSLIGCLLSIIVWYDDGSIARITHPNGSITIERDDDQFAALLHTKIYPGDTIITGANSETTLQFKDNTVVTLDADSSMNIHDKEYKKLQLRSGQAFFQFTPQEKAAQVSTDYLNTTVLGTKFRLWNQSDGRMLELVKGKVSVSGHQDLQNIELTDGHALNKDDNGYYISPLPLTPVIANGMQSWQVKFADMPWSGGQGIFNLWLPEQSLQNKTLTGLLICGSGSNNTSITREFWRHQGMRNVAESLGLGLLYYQLPDPYDRSLAIPNSTQSLREQSFAINYVHEVVTHLSHELDMDSIRTSPWIPIQVEGHTSSATILGQNNMSLATMLVCQDIPKEIETLNHPVMIFQTRSSNEDLQHLDHGVRTGKQWTLFIRNESNRLTHQQHHFFRRWIGAICTQSTEIPYYGGIYLGAKNSYDVVLLPELSPPGTYNTWLPDESLGLYWRKLIK